MSKRGERLRKGVTQHIEGEPGELGRLESTGAYTVPTGQLNEVYVRLNGDPNNLVTAIDLVTSRKARLPVLVRKTPSGTYKVIGTDPLKINQFLGVDAPSGSVPPVRGSTVNAVWESYQLNPGRVRALNGSDLQVYMEPLPYGNGDLGGVSGNMATVAGTITSGKKAWIAVAVDPDTNVLSFTKGTEYALPVPIGTRAFATAVAVPDGEIPLWAYLIRAGATYVPVQPTSPDSLFFVDRRGWLQLPQTIGDVDAVHINIAGEIAGLTRKVSPVSADKVIIEDSADSNSKKYVEIGDLPSGATDYPTRWAAQHYTSTVTHGNALIIDTASTFAAQVNRYTAYQNTAANADSFTQSFVLAAGTYTLSTLGSTLSNGGKIDWYLDAEVSPQVVGQDWYTGGTVLNVIQTHSITVTGDGYHKLTGLVNGQNGSSSGYFICLTELSIKAASD